MSPETLKLYHSSASLSVPADYMALKRWYETVSSRASAAA
jgi:hypothetical protein